METNCKLKVRLPNGQSTDFELPESTPLSVVLASIEETTGESGLLLSIPFPRKVFSSEEMGLTLKEAGLHPRGAVIAQRGIAVDMQQDKTPIVKAEVHHIHSEAEYNKFKNTANKLVVVDFSATWCGPCKAIAPVYEQLAKSTPTVVFLHVDVDENRGLPDANDVSGIPTFKFFKNGKLLKTFSGANPQELKSTVEQLK
eukprot:TRINITY_DN4474_c0_g1_i1.p1 TRINITY_DN4474_c0_g1~~TRINITY_DN4474_c0_g1_i1.p1  ORF type:complete len:199 (+),score=31.84 TRINITY_DN4474_c0_g1_i1:134-730(+)